MSTKKNEMWANLDHERKEAFSRALGQAAASGTGLLDDYVNRVIEQLHVRELGLLSALDRRQGQGSQAIINRRESNATLAQWLDDGTAPTDKTGTYTQATFQYKTLTTRGQVSRKLRSMGRAYADVLAEEMSAKMEDFNAALESALVIGDASVTTTQISGFLKLSVAGQVIANSANVAGAAVSLSKLDEAIDAVKGHANREDLIIVGNPMGLRSLNAALQADQQFLQAGEIEGGFRVRMYDGIPIVPSTGVTTDMQWDGTAITAFSGASSNKTTAIFVINKRHCWIEELTPTTMLPLARSSSEFEKFDIYWDGALVIANTKGFSVLGGITGG